jgi:chromosome segregation ATPase
MSEPTRYTGKTEGSVLGSPHWEHPEGEWVKYEDYARLKAEVERLKKFNEEAMAHIAKEERKSRERLEMAEDENAHLKADVNELADGLKLASEVGIKMADEVTRLKAEVERLTKQNALATPRHLIASQDIKTLREQIEELKLENSQYEEHHKYGQNVITSLREEVERLTKAGDAMLSEWASGEEKDAKNFLKALVIWNAAKEGKQS